MTLQQLKTLYRKATPGLWRVRKGHGLCFVEAPKQNGMPYGLDVCGEDYTGYGDEAQREIHMNLIAEMFNALPDLIAAAERDAKRDD